ncbi:MAG TPA: methyl-accepting chemotaxis protein [Candidatus Binatia bacterium]|nr:methyl-accepting chemotaxis protein [Candidatus Binatia bacterium]
MGVSFGAMVVLAAAIGATGILALRSVAASKDRVILVNEQNLIAARDLVAAAERKGGAARAFLLTGDERFLATLDAARNDMRATIARLEDHSYADDGRRMVEEVKRAEAEHQAALEHAVAERGRNAALDVVARLFEEQVTPRRDALDRAVAAFVAREERLADDAERAAASTASTAIVFLVAIVLAAVALALALAIVLGRTLTRQVGAAVHHIQSSSAELQSAANQQAAGAKEQATGMNEISTTIGELLATSRQIAESAQRVAQIAQETADAAGAGDQTVQKSQEAVGAVKRQVDVIVAHMLDLGRKSQQIGGILEIINELADQTNILAINASIEAAGANDAGRRFGVVADEIRKLADRVGASTKEIRALIEEVRTAVNTTVMATEGGMKAADAGMREFGAVTTAFRQIVELVGTTTEAAREIELSTKQQASAVEQVNVAVSGMARATKENEASSRQTLETASQLATLSTDLTRLIRVNGAEA